MDNSLILGAAFTASVAAFAVIKHIADRIRGKYDEAAQVQREYHREYRNALSRQHDAMEQLQQRMREMGVSAEQAGEAMRSMGRVMGGSAPGSSGSGGNVVIRGGTGGGAGNQAAQDILRNARQYGKTEAQTEVLKQKQLPADEGRSRAEILRERSLED